MARKAHPTKFATLVLMACCLTALKSTDAQVQEGLHDQIMERKLAVTQEVVEGIARSDFERIRQQAQKLHLLSREAGWNVLATKSYLRMSEDFRATALQLEDAAQNENLDAVGLAYVKLSISCIECHRHARQQAQLGVNAPNRTNEEASNQ